jgi:hypothetical protein
MLIERVQKSVGNVCCERTICCRRAVASGADEADFVLNLHHENCLLLVGLVKVFKQMRERVAVGF